MWAAFAPQFRRRQLPLVPAPSARSKPFPKDYPTWARSWRSDPQRERETDQQPGARLGRVYGRDPGCLYETGCLNRVFNAGALGLMPRLKTFPVRWPTLDGQRAIHDPWTSHRLRGRVRRTAGFVSVPSSFLAELSNRLPDRPADVAELPYPKNNNDDEEKDDEFRYVASKQDGLRFCLCGIIRPYEPQDEIGVHDTPRVASWRTGGRGSVWPTSSSATDR
jgi:hypothetical protein